MAVNTTILILGWSVTCFAGHALSLYCARAMIDDLRWEWLFSISFLFCLTYLCRRISRGKTDLLTAHLEARPQPDFTIYGIKLSHISCETMGPTFFVSCLTKCVCTARLPGTEHQLIMIGVLARRFLLDSSSALTQVSCLTETCQKFCCYYCVIPPIPTGVATPSRYAVDTRTICAYSPDGWTSTSKSTMLSAGLL